MDRSNQPRDAGSLMAKAYCALSRGLLQETETLALSACVTEESGDSHALLAEVLDRRGDWAASIKHLRRVCELNPNSPQARLNLGMSLLRLGNYHEGLALYEARLDKPTWSGFATVQSRIDRRSELLRPGDDVAHRRVLLLAEQGLGDAIMCARYLPMLANKGARITVACNPTLGSFFSGISQIEAILSPPSAQPLAQINLAAAQFDAWLPLFSLPYCFGTELGSIPTQFAYRAETLRIAAWRAKFAAAGRTGKPKIGLVFQANPQALDFRIGRCRSTILHPFSVLILQTLSICNMGGLAASLRRTRPKS
jgi:hypothetical protein